MGTITSTISIVSADLITDAISLSVADSATASHTTGIARMPITSTSKGTASGQVVLYTASDFAATAYLYIKNAGTTATEYVNVYVDTATDDPDLLKLDAGEWAFLPLNADATLSAYTSNSGTLVEWMVYGTDA